MADATTAQLVAAVENLSSTVGTIKAQLAPLLSSTYAETVSKLAPAERAKFQVLLAYSANALFWAYLKTQGVSPNEHPVKLELQRVREYINKIKETENPAKPTMTVDKEAAARFIKHHLPKIQESADVAMADADEPAAETHAEKGANTASGAETAQVATKKNKGKKKKGKQANTAAASSGNASDASSTASQKRPAKTADGSSKKRKKKGGQ
ncbi:Sas10/Utp3/C1D family-domain-containing protein [Thamnocephalis sphaerospora]|uniref:Exosome complex protein n=1 Tax=Thamnocephalis sphaerospora TaxID=78915 RepID=A0A4P9XMU2_9FUNG|nr:Sas10/Utp3/C1D family-domain-containing protein [Thamnocephalis sphaerospora]|eukprot:RKP07215.1 Sas10/Utp3/C1D family-domain-containing protein [Thamnocephalis sphaerospora]